MKRSFLFFILAVIMAVPELSSAGVPQATIEQLLKVYTAAADRVAKIVLEPGNSPAKIARAHQLSAQIDDVLHQLKTFAARWSGNAIASAAMAGMLRANIQAAGVGVDVPTSPARGAFALVDHAAVQQFAADTAADLFKSANNMGDRAKRVLRQTGQMGLNEADINTILAGGVIDGQPRETIGLLRDALEAVHGNKVPIQTKSGIREYGVDYYAQMVARTKTRQATTQARHDRLQSLGMDLVSIIGRISNNFCSAYLGQVYSLSGKSSKYPALTELPGGGPPFHPNCSKSTRPFVEELASERELSQAEGDDDQSKMLGIDPTTAQQRYKALGLKQQVKQNYATTAKELFGAAVSK